MAGSEGFLALVNQAVTAAVMVLRGADVGPLSQELDVLKACLVYRSRMATDHTRHNPGG